MKQRYVSAAAAAPMRLHHTNRVTFQTGQVRLALEALPVVSAIRFRGCPAKFTQNLAQLCIHSHSSSGWCEERRLHKAAPRVLPSAVQHHRRGRGQRMPPISQRCAHQSRSRFFVRSYRYAESVQGSVHGVSCTLCAVCASKRPFRC